MTMATGENNVHRVNRVFVIAPILGPILRQAMCKDGNRLVANFESRSS
jgi:hypothetical protein